MSAKLKTVTFFGDGQDLEPPRKWTAFSSTTGSVVRI